MKCRCLSLALLLLYLLPQPASGQTGQKKMLTESDYALWSNFALTGISPDGRWSSYRVAHAAADTLFVQELKGKKIHAFPNGSEGRFGSDYFICKGKDSTLHYLDLRNGVRKTFQAATGHAVLERHFIVQGFKNGAGSLTLYNPNGTVSYSFPNAVSFSYSANRKLLAIIEKTDDGQILYYVAIAAPQDKVFISGAKDARYGRLAWDSSGIRLYFLEDKEGTISLGCHDTLLRQNHLLQSATAELGGAPILDRTLSVAEDGRRVFFLARKRKEDIPADNAPVQVWNSMDRALYPTASKIDNWKNTPHLGMWEPQSGRVLKVTDSLLPWGGPIGKGLHALTHNPLTYEPQEKPLADRDIYLTDLATGHRKLLLEQQDGSDFQLAGSPDGRFVLYFREQDWHSYAIATGQHVNLTKGMRFSPSIMSMQKETPAYGFGGWCLEDSSVLLYDECDVWRFSADGSKSERLTKGRESGTIFRIVPYKERQENVVAHRTTTLGTYDLKEKLLLSASASDYSKNGYSIWEQGKGAKEIVYTAKNTKNILKAADSESFVWTEEDYGTPIRLMAKAGRSKNKIAYSSNSHQSDFVQGRMELVRYLSPAGMPLSGLLYYPVAFKKGNHYPMVVHIYEMQSKNRFAYISPTLCNGDGFNIANLTAKGYFVLLPDTVFETPATGDCALRCVEAAVAEVLNLGAIDPKRIGLIGHSFGGYETDYIITKSRLFACAVAGAAMTNLTSAAHAMAPSVRRPNFFKIENAQVRMKGSFFEYRQQYLENSPVLLADGVQTPLLSWTGAADSQVLPTQTMEFYMALRRLRKKQVMLLYPYEGHNLLDKAADADLTVKIESWFGYYLNGGPEKDWMKAK